MNGYDPLNDQEIAALLQTCLLCFKVGDLAVIRCKCRLEVRICARCLELRVLEGKGGLGCCKRANLGLIVRHLGALVGREKLQESPEQVREGAAARIILGMKVVVRELRPPCSCT